MEAVLEYLGITNLELAKALGYDPSLISRYLSGHRVFKAASEQMDAIANYILSRTGWVQDIDWLKAQFMTAALPDGQVNKNWETSRCFQPFQTSKKRGMNMMRSIPALLITRLINTAFTAK